MDFIKTLNNLKEGTYIKVTGAKVKNDNGLYIVESDYSKPDPRYCVVNNERCCLKIKQDGTLSKAKYNILFISDRTPERDTELKIEIVSKEELKTAGKKLNTEIKENEEKEFVTIFEKSENQEIVNGSIVKFEKNLSYGTCGNKCLSRNRFYQLTLSSVGTLRVKELGKKGQYISTGENFICSTNLKNEILSKAIVLVKKEVLKSSLKKNEKAEAIETIILENKEIIKEITFEATIEEKTTEEKKEIMITSISYETARRAFYWLSFHPDERGKSIIEEMNKEIENFKNKLLEIDNSKEKEIFQDIKDWVIKYDIKKTIWLNALSRCASSGITGGANFPVEKNKKRMNIEKRKNEECLEWNKKYKKMLIKKYSPESKVKTIFEEVEEIKTANRKGYFKQLDKESLTAKLFNYANINIENLKEVKEIAKKETSLFTSKHKIHRMIENLEKKYTRIDEGTANKEEIINSIKIIDSEQNNRIELYFEGIPSTEIRKHLKSKGFKWSPNKGAWQNFRNQLRLQEIKKYITQLS